MSSSARPQPRPRLESAERRALILQAASEMFAKQGYDQASMRKIASAAGVTTPVVYDHFESKTALYIDLLQAYADDLIAHWVPTDASGPEELLSQSIDAFFAWIEEHEQGWRMLFMDLSTDETVAATQRAIQDRATRRAATLFEQVPHLDVSTSLDRGRMNEFFAETVKTALNGVAAWWWANRDVSRADVVALTTDLLWRGLGRMTFAVE